MIRCPKCDAENQIGSIFCRSCGERLNLDELRPEEIAKHSRQSGVKTAALIAGRAVKLVILLALILSLVGLFVPPRQAMGDYEGGREKYRSARMKVAALRRGAGRGTRFALSAAEINALADAEGGFADEEFGISTGQEQVREDILASVGVHVWPRSGGYVKCVLKSTLLKRIPLYSTVVFKLQTGEAGLVARVTSARVGRVPMPGPAKQLPLARFEAIFPDVAELYAEMAPSIEEIETSAEQVVIQMAD